MAKKIKLIPLENLRPGNDIMIDGVVRTPVLVDPVIDPRGGILLDTPKLQWYVRFADGEVLLMSGSAEAA